MDYTYTIQGKAFFRVYAPACGKCTSLLAINVWEVFACMGRGEKGSLDLLSFPTPECIPLPDLTVLQCSSTIVEFAMQWHPGPSWNTRGINIDTACKSLDGSNVSYNINQACSLVTSCFQEVTV